VALGEPACVEAAIWKVPLPVMAGLTIAARLRQCGTDTIRAGSSEISRVATPRVRRRLTREEAGQVVPDESVAYSPFRRSTVPAWPLMSYLELAALPTCVGCARKHARAVTLEFGLPELADTIELVVSELLTNSVRASNSSPDAGLTTPVVRLWLASDLQCVLIRVWDSSSQMPVQKYPGPDDDSGRGLMLVTALASEWGAYPSANGKEVWVIIR
jgi:anti-sigma regulatory factor (Ser/Thr protein kinase)